jgi:hypothetical protein
MLDAKIEMQSVKDAGTVVLRGHVEGGEFVVHSLRSM